MEARPQPDAHRAAPLTPDRLHAEHRVDPPQLEASMLQDLKLVLQALNCL